MVHRKLPEGHGPALLGDYGSWPADGIAVYQELQCNEALAELGTFRVRKVTK